MTTATIALAELAEKGADIDVLRLVRGRVTNYKDAEMALRWTAAGFLEAERSFRKLRGHEDLKTLINGLRPAIQQFRKAA